MRPTAAELRPGNALQIVVKRGRVRLYNVECTVYYRGKDDFMFSVPAVNLPFPESTPVRQYTKDNNNTRGKQSHPAQNDTHNTRYTSIQCNYSSQVCCKVEQRSRHGLCQRQSGIKLITAHPGTLAIGIQLSCPCISTIVDAVSCCLKGQGI